MSLGHRSANQQKGADKVDRYATIGAVAFALYFVGILLGISTAKPNAIGEVVLAKGVAHETDITLLAFFVTVTLNRWAAA